MAEGITSIEELKKAQAAAQEAGTSITNYEEWANILEDLDIAGVQSTGTYAGDVKLHSQIIAQVQDMIEQAQEIQAQEQQQVQNNDFNKTDYKTSQDKEQTVKANVVNATSSMIMADYMKYYHLLQ
jgi:purine-nucleoside phosphorylase